MKGVPRGSPIPKSRMHGTDICQSSNDHIFGLHCHLFFSSNHISLDEHPKRRTSMTEICSFAILLLIVVVVFLWQGRALSFLQIPCEYRPQSSSSIFPFWSALVVQISYDPGGRYVKSSVIIVGDKSLPSQRARPCVTRSSILMTMLPAVHSLKIFVGAVSTKWEKLATSRHEAEIPAFSQKVCVAEW